MNTHTERDYGDEWQARAAPRPALTLAPAPPPRPDATLDAADRWHARFLAERTARQEAAVRATVLATALAAREETIAALTARVAALTDLCWGLGVGMACLLLLLVLRLLGGL